MKKKPVGHPPATGPRVQVRFKKDRDVKTIRRAVAKINTELDVGQITFNSFVAGAATKEAERILKGVGL